MFGRLGYGPIDLCDPLVREHPLNRGLVAHWLVLPGLDGGTTWWNIAELNHGTLTNMTTAGTSGWGSTTRPGGFGEMRFDGSNDYVSAAIGNTPVGASPFTASVWMFPRTAGVGNYGTSLSWGNTAFFTAVIIAMDGTGGTSKIRFGRYNDDFIVTSQSLTLGGWSQVVLTYDGTTLSSYINAAADNTATRSLNTASTGFRIGDLMVSGGQPFDGKLDSVRIYNRALSASEVRWLYDEERTGHRETLRRMFTVGPRRLFVPRRTLYTNASRYL